jgi:hypothetical protein
MPLDRHGRRTAGLFASLWLVQSARRSQKGTSPASRVDTCTTSTSVSARSPSFQAPFCVKMNRLFGYSREVNRRFNLAEGGRFVCTVRHHVPIANAELFARGFATTAHGRLSPITGKPCSAAAVLWLPTATHANSPFSITAPELLLSPSNPVDRPNPLAITGNDEMGNFLRSPRTAFLGRWQHKTHASLILRYYWRRVKRAFTPARHRTRSRNTQS